MHIKQIQFKLQIVKFHEILKALVRNLCQASRISYGREIIKKIKYYVTKYHKYIVLGSFSMYK